jgi:Flp pilus assembly secretin CpaC
MIVYFEHMKYHTSLIILALLASLLAGCSKHSAMTVSPNLNSTDLGIVEVSDGIAIHHDLDGSRACVITPTVFKDGSVRLAIAIQETNSAGVVETLATPSVKNMAGQPVMVSVGDIAIHLTPKIKP